MPGRVHGQFYLTAKRPTDTFLKVKTMRRTHAKALRRKDKNGTRMNADWADLRGSGPRGNSPIRVYPLNPRSSASYFFLLSAFAPLREILLAL
jgi:hypothetical protein